MPQLIIDVSEHNGAVDWQQVKDAGYHAILRIGFGRFDSGGRYDLQWERNVAECERLDIPYGAYWYSYAASAESARVEAYQAVSALSGHTPSYPVYFDTEEPGTEAVSKANACAFGDVVEAAGYWCGVYASESWWRSNLGGLDRFTKWVANWSARPSLEGADLWQRSGADGSNVETCPGVGKVDVNVLLRETLASEVAGGSSEPTLTVQCRAAEVMEHYADHDASHGYSQHSRNGDGGSETLTLSDGLQVTVATGDRDCSSGVISAYEAVLPGSTGHATYTGNMKEGFLSTGLWQWHPMGDGYIAQRGDVYLNEVHHTAMCVSADPDLMAQFSISETGGVDGRTGDQTGWECSVKPYADYPWDGKLVYTGPQPSGMPPASQTQAARIAVDGWWGRETTEAAQKSFGTEPDGEVWGQAQAWLDANPGLTGGWVVGNGGSPLVRAMQSWLAGKGHDVGDFDGIAGVLFWTAFCSEMGFPDDHVDGPSKSVKEFQRRLNAGAL